MRFAAARPETTLVISSRTASPSQTTRVLTPTENSVTISTKLNTLSGNPTSMNQAERKPRATIVVPDCLGRSACA